jgi:hypothetical protein
MRIAVLRDAYCVMRDAACLRSLKEDAGTSRFLNGFWR